MSGLRIVVMGWIVRGPSAGMAWHYLNFLGSLLEMGHDAYFIEDSSGTLCYDSSFEQGGTDPSFGLSFAARAFDQLDLGDRWAYFDEYDNQWKGGRARDAVDLCSSADIVINVSGVNRLRSWFDRASARIYVDTDPGFTQIKNLTEPASRKLCAEHSAFLTFGENINKEQCSVPPDGFAWQPIRQPIWLRGWPYSTDRRPDRFTTVMQWESYRTREYGGLRLGMKSESFRRILELPLRAGQVFEAAIGRPFPRRELIEAGWQVPDIGPIVQDPVSYRRFIQTSGAEIGIAKMGYVVTQSGWFGERSAAYLASGCPVLHQDTGFTANLPSGSGLIPFAGIEDAAEGVRSIRSDYDRHSRAARDIAESYFSPSQIVPALLDRASGASARTRQQSLPSTPRKAGIPPRGEPRMNLQRNGPVDSGRIDDVAEQRASLAISAAVCTFMRYDLLKQAIDSIRNQQLDPSRYEILVIDNSPDEALSKRMSLEYSELHNLRWIIEHKPGESNARNAAVANAKSPIIAFLDDDAVASAGWLGAILSGFDSGEDVAAVGGKVNPIWGATRPAWLHDDLLGYLSILDWGNELRPIKWGEWLIAANLAFRVALVRGVGGFQTQLGRRSGEQVLMSNCEMDVVDRLRSRGYRALYNPAAAIDHLIHPQRLTQSWMRRRVVWQAISNYIMDPAGQYKNAATVQAGLSAVLRTAPRSLTESTDDPDRFAEQIELLRDLTQTMLAGFDGTAAGDATGFDEVVLSLAAPGDAPLAGGAPSPATGFAAPAATASGAAQPGSAKNTHSAQAPEPRIQLVKLYGESFLELYARRHPGLFAVRKELDNLDPGSPIGLVIGADVPEDIDVFLPKVLSDDHLRALLKSRAVLIMDGSGEGPGFSPSIARNMHDSLAAADIDPARAIFLTQNHRYRADYDSWRLDHNISKGIVIHLFHYYMRETVKVISAMLDELITSSGRRIQGEAPAPSRRYICLNNKARGHRAIVLGWLSKRNLLGIGHVSFLGGDRDIPTFEFGAAIREAAALFPAFQQELDAFRQLCRNAPLSISGDNLDENVTFGLSSQLKLHEDAAFSLVTETEMTSSGQIRRFTEKSLKPLAFGHPMLVAGYPGTLALLRSYGFRTFYPVIDESYDEVIDPQRRLQMVLAEFERLALLPEPEMSAIRSRLAETLIYNVGVFERHLPEIIEREDAWLAWLLAAIARGSSVAGASPGETTMSDQAHSTPSAGVIRGPAKAGGSNAANAEAAAETRVQALIGGKPREAAAAGRDETGREPAGTEAARAKDPLASLGERPVPPHVYLPKGMLVPAEQRLLYQLASYYYSGEGAIIDAGAFCGASTYALAAGLSDNSGSFTKDGRIHAYDLFVADDDSTREYLQNIFYTRFDRGGDRAEIIRKVSPGESFIDVFAFQTQRYENLIQTHAGSILDQSWSGEKIEVIFLDVCKTLEIQEHVLGAFLPHMIAGKSVLIQRDFHHPWHPYIHVVMEYLDPYLDIVLSAVGGSRVYRLRSPVPRDVLEKAAGYEFTEEDTIRLLDRTVEKAPAGERRMLSAVLARQLFLVGDVDRCHATIVGTLSGMQGGGRAAFEALIGDLCPGVYETAATGA